jgi:hypothetical protein
MAGKSMREAAALRLTEAGERGMPATMAILAFETPVAGRQRSG